MFSTGERYPTAAGRWFREAKRRHANPLAEFVSSLDVMIYLVGGALAACLIAILLE